MIGVFYLQAIENGEIQPEGFIEEHIRPYAKSIDYYKPDLFHGCRILLDEERQPAPARPLRSRTG